MAIIKHANPCGVSINQNKVKSFKEALESDPISAFGGVVSCNYKIKKNLALELKKLFFEVIICKGIENKAIKILKNKKNLRIIDSSNLKNINLINISSQLNSYLLQTSDTSNFTKSNFKVVSKIKPNPKTLKNQILK